MLFAFGCPSVWPYVCITLNFALLHKIENQSVSVPLFLSLSVTLSLFVSLCLNWQNHLLGNLFLQLNCLSVSLSMSLSFYGSSFLCLSVSFSLLLCLSMCLSLSFYFFFFCLGNIVS